MTISTWFSQHRDEIRAFFVSIGAWIAQTFANFKQFVEDHLEEFKMAAIAIVVIIFLVVVVPQAVLFLLQAIGFAAHGVVAGLLVLPQLNSASDLLQVRLLLFISPRCSEGSLWRVVGSQSVSQ